MKILAKPLLSGPGVFRANNLGIAKTIKSFQHTSRCGKLQIAMAIKLLKNTPDIQKWHINLPKIAKIDQLRFKLNTMDLFTNFAYPAHSLKRHVLPRQFYLVIHLLLLL